MSAIVVEGLCKTYVTHKKSPGISGAIKSLFTREKVEVKAVVDVSFEIQQGEMVGFLGPNGAGKTTTLKMLSGILYPTAGRAEVLGYTPFDRKPEMLKQIAIVMGNKQQLWWDLPAWDSFIVLKELYEVSESDFKRRVDALIEALQISDKVNTQVRKLSLGERMKCELVAALIHAPRVVFLDEPTLGLDVVSQKRIREFLKDLHREDGNTVLLTSHYMQDVEELCERVIVIDHGQMVFGGTLHALTKQFSNTRKLQLTFSSAVSAESLNALGCVVESDETSAMLEIPPDKMASVTSQALQSLPVADIAIQEVDIEDVIRELFSQKR